MTAGHWDHPNPFTLSVAVTEDDIDGLNHTNNTVYVKWCEQVAWAHSNALGLDLACYQSLDRAMAITRAEYDYLQAARLGDKLTLATWITDWDGRLTMRRQFQMVRNSDQTTVLRGVMHFACIAMSNGKPRRFPKAFVDGYGPAILFP